MTLKLCQATSTDAPRIAEIHMAAFGSNALLRAQFPTPAVRAALQLAIEQKALADIHDPKTSVLVVRDLKQKQEGGVSMTQEYTDEAKGEVVSFSKWGHPISEGEDYTEPMWIWPDGTNLDLLDKWSQKADVAYKNTLGHTPCYRLSFIGTDPMYERRGAASLMLQWGIDQCKKYNASAYLESTVEAGPLYEKNGFARMGALSITIDGILEDGPSVIYEEICFLFQPSL